MSIGVGSYLVAILVIFLYLTVIGNDNFVTVLVKAGDFIPRAEDDAITVVVISVDISPFVFLYSVAEFVVFENLSILAFYDFKSILRVVYLELPL